MRDGNFHFIKEFTKKNDFYTHTENGIVFLVLNAVMDRIPADEYDQCTSLDLQYELINTVLDTLVNAAHLIVLTHYVTWGYIEPEFTDVSHNANSDHRWSDYQCHVQSEFQEAVYPKLIEVRQRGVNVYVISGDGGQKDKGHHYQTQDGINLMISGINNSVDSTRYEPAKDFNFEPDSVLLFHQDILAGTLSFEFVELNELIE